MNKVPVWCRRSVHNLIPAGAVRSIPSLRS